MIPESIVASGAAARTGVNARASLLFRGQFVLGPRCVEQLIDGATYPVANGVWLTAHPELPVTQVSQGSRALTLIGYMLDPIDPGADDRRILSRLLDACGSIRQLIAATADLGGRWLLAATCDDGMHLFADALGLRHAVYTQPADTDGLWVMSQAGLAVDILGLPVDRQAAEFLDSEIVRARHPEYYWPGASTPLRGLRHLLPNHVLQLRTAQVTRYWPDSPLPALSLDEAVERVALLMPGLLRAAAARFELALSITAGVDSRLVLAAAREIKDRLCYVTVRQAKMADDHDDILVPGRLLARLGLQHEVIRAAGSMSPEFSWAFKRGVFLAHDHYGADAEAILQRFGRTKVALTGSGGEVGRCSFRRELPLAKRRRITAADLARVEHMYHPYAIRFFQEWLDDVGDCRQVNLLDLFEWEQGHGNWLALTQLEFDMAWRDIFTPYNCRTLLTAMLAVNERFRRGPAYRLFHAATVKLWPEVLSEPVNPHKQTGRWKHWAHALRQSVRTYVRAS